jgi:hypothetical protein
MTPALVLATAATLGWGNPAELRRIEPNDLLAAAFVAQLSARLDARLSFESNGADAAALGLWYPPVPAARVLDVARASDYVSRRDVRYSLSLPYFRFKP